MSTGDVTVAGQCLCRECQYFSGGGPNFFLLVPEHGCKLVAGAGSEFARSDLDKRSTRIFCAICGIDLATTSREMSPVVVLKVGTLDYPSVCSPEVAIFTSDRQPFHTNLDGVHAFEKAPP